MSSGVIMIVLGFFAFLLHHEILADEYYRLIGSVVQPPFSMVLPSETLSTPQLPIMPIIDRGGDFLLRVGR